MKTACSGSLVLICGVAASVVAGAGGAPYASGYSQAPSVRVVGPGNDSGLSMERLHAMLVARQVTEGLDSGLRVEVQRSVREALAAGDEAELRLRVGVMAPVEAQVVIEPSRATVKGVEMARYGALRRSSGGVVWSLGIESPGASGVRLHLTGVDLPEGAELYLYNLQGEAFGPYSGSGELWTHSVPGELAVLQLEAPSLDRAASFTIAELGHLGERWPYGASQDAAKAFCSFNAGCVQNVNCGGASNAVSDARDGVAHMVFRSGAYLYICSGGLLANDANRPYFLTANHCISKGSEASSLEAYFGFETTCGGACFDGRTVSNRVLGSSIASSNRTGDYTLLELTSFPPEGGVAMGWNSSPIADSDGTHLYRVSHPKGAPQAYSEHDVDTSKGTCRTWPRGPWIYSHDVFGATEGGSSGSPVVNGSGQVVGQLSGACGTNVNDSCDATRNATVDGAFASYYGSIANLLGGGATCDPAETCGDGIDNDCNGLIDDGCSGGGCTDADNDGVCAENGDCDDNNPDVYPGHNDSKGRWGRDGVDNDCNGVIDG